jgi:hypothetical protein
MNLFRNHWLATIQIQHGELIYYDPLIISMNENVNFFQDTNRWFDDIQKRAFNWYYGEHTMEDADKMNNGYLINCGDRHIELKLNKKLSFLDFYVLKKEMTHLDYDKLLKEEKEYEMRTV